jgi:hypothetical protein
MKIYTEENLTNFEFWGGARDTVRYLTDDELEQIEAILEDLNPDGMSDTEINDFFWFEDDTIAEWLGYADFEELMHRDDEEEEDEDEEEDENYFIKEPWDI